MQTYSDDIKKDFSPRDPIAKRVDEVIAKRYSTRAFEKMSINNDDLALVFEAARLAPSCQNEQPWRFHVSGSKTFNKYLDLLVDGNQEWAKDASNICFITAKKDFDHNGKDNGYAWFDCGAAWFALTYQARKLGLYTHGMAGIKKDEVRSQLSIDDNYDVVCGFAIGVIDEQSAVEEDITPRKSLADILSIDD